MARGRSRPSKDEALRDFNLVPSRIAELDARAAFKNLRAANPTGGSGGSGVDGPCGANSTSCCSASPRAPPIATRSSLGAKRKPHSLLAALSVSDVSLRDILSRLSKDPRHCLGLLLRLRRADLCGGAAQAELSSGQGGALGAQTSEDAARTARAHAGPDGDVTRVQEAEAARSDCARDPLLGRGRRRVDHRAGREVGAARRESLLGQGHRRHPVDVLRDQATRRLPGRRRRRRAGDIRAGRHLAQLELPRGTRPLLRRAQALARRHVLAARDADVQARGWVVGRRANRGGARGL